MYSQLNESQKLIFDQIIIALQSTSIECVLKLYFIDGLGGSGKTFLFEVNKIK